MSKSPPRCDQTLGTREYKYAIIIKSVAAGALYGFCGEESVGWYPAHCQPMDNEIMIHSGNTQARKYIYRKQTICRRIWLFVCRRFSLKSNTTMTTVARANKIAPRKCGKTIGEVYANLAFQSLNQMYKRY